MGGIIVDSTSEGQEPGGEPGRLVFSSYGHVLGLVDGVLFGTGRPARRPGPGAATRNVPHAARMAIPDKNPAGDADCC